MFFGEKGIIDLLRRYKFAVEENTPPDQEVALDTEARAIVRRVEKGYVSSAKQAEVAELVNNILSIKRKNPMANVSELEAEIDRWGFALYGLTDAEIGLVMGGK